jgi:hypothetical protein
MRIHHINGDYIYKGNWFNNYPVFEYNDYKIVADSNHYLWLGASTSKIYETNDASGEPYDFYTDLFSGPAWTLTDSALELNTELHRISINLGGNYPTANEFDGLR